MKILLKWWFEGFKMIVLWALAMAVALGVISLGAWLFNIFPLLLPIIVTIALIIFVPLAVYALAN